MEIDTNLKFESELVRNADTKLKKKSSATCKMYRIQDIYHLYSIHFQNITIFWHTIHPFRVIRTMLFNKHIIWLKPDGIDIEIISKGYPLLLISISILLF